MNTYIFQAEIIRILKENSIFSVDSLLELKGKQKNKLDYDGIIKFMETDDSDNDDKKTQTLFFFIDQYQKNYYDSLNDTQKDFFYSVLSLSNPILDFWVALNNFNALFSEKKKEWNEFYNLKNSYNAAQMEKKSIELDLFKFNNDLQNMKKYIDSFGIDTKKLIEKNKDEKEILFFKRYLSLLYQEGKEGIVVCTLFSILGPVRTYFQNKVKETLFFIWTDLITEIGTVKSTAANFFNQLDLDEKKKKEEEEIKNEKMEIIEEDLNFEKIEYNYLIYQDIKNDRILKENTRSIFKFFDQYDQHLQQKDYLLWKKNEYLNLKKQIESNDYLSMENVRDFHIYALYYVYFKNIIFNLKEKVEQLRNGTLEVIYFENNSKMSKSVPFGFIKENYKKIYNDDVEKISSFKNLFKYFGSIIYSINNIICSIALSEKLIYKKDAFFRTRFEIQNFSLIDNFGDVLKEGISFLKIKETSEFNTLITFFKLKKGLNVFVKDKIRFFPFDIQFKILLLLLCFSHLKVPSSDEFKKKMEFLIKNPHGFLVATGLKKNKPFETGNEEKDENKKRKNEETTENDQSSKKIKLEEVEVEEVEKLEETKFTENLQKDFQLTIDPLIDETLQKKKYSPNPLDPEEPEKNISKIINEPSKTETKDGVNEKIEGSQSSSSKPSYIQPFSRKPSSRKSSSRLSLSNRSLSNQSSSNQPLSRQSSSNQPLSDANMENALESLSNIVKQLPKVETETQTEKKGEVNEKMQKDQPFQNDKIISFFLSEKKKNSDKKKEELKNSLDNLLKDIQKNEEFKNSLDNLLEDIQKNEENKEEKTMNENINGDLFKKMVEFIKKNATQSDNNSKIKNSSETERNGNGLSDIIIDEVNRNIINPPIQTSENLNSTFLIDSIENVVTDIQNDDGINIIKLYQMLKNFFEIKENFDKLEDFYNAMKKKFKGSLLEKKKPGFLLHIITFMDAIQNKESYPDLKIDQETYDALIKELEMENIEKIKKNTIFIAEFFIKKNFSIERNYKKKIINIIGKGSINPIQNENEKKRIQDGKKRADIDKKIEKRKLNIMYDIKKNFMDKFNETIIFNFVNNNYNIKEEDIYKYCDDINNVWKNYLKSFDINANDPKKKMKIDIEEKLISKKKIETIKKKVLSFLKSDRNNIKKLIFDKTKPHILTSKHKKINDSISKQTMITYCLIDYSNSVLKWFKTLCPQGNYSEEFSKEKYASWVPHLWFAEKIKKHYDDFEKKGEISSLIFLEEKIKVDIIKKDNTLSEAKKEVEFIVWKNLMRHHGSQGRILVDVKQFVYSIGDVLSKIVNVFIDVIGVSIWKLISLICWIVTEKIPFAYWVLKKVLWGVGSLAFAPIAWVWLPNKLEKKKILDDIKNYDKKVSEFEDIVNPKKTSKRESVRTFNQNTISSETLSYDEMISRMNAMKDYVDNKIIIAYSGGELVKRFRNRWISGVIDSIPYITLILTYSGAIGERSYYTQLVDTVFSGAGLLARNLMGANQVLAQVIKVVGDVYFVVSSPIFLWTVIIFGLAVFMFTHYYGEDIFDVLIQTHERYGEIYIKAKDLVTKIENLKNEIDKLKNPGKENFPGKGEKSGKPGFFEKIQKSFGKKDNNDTQDVLSERAKKMDSQTNSKEVTSYISKKGETFVNNPLFKADVSLEKFLEIMKNLKKKMERYVFTEFGDDYFNEEGELDEKVLEFEKILNNLHFEIKLFQKMIKDIGLVIGDEKILAFLNREKIEKNEKQKIKNVIDKFNLGNSDDPLVIFFTYKKMQNKNNNLKKWTNDFVKKMIDEKVDTIENNREFFKSFEEYIKSLNIGTHSSIMKLDKFLELNITHENKKMFSDKLKHFNQYLSDYIASLFNEYMKPVEHMRKFNDLKIKLDTEINEKVSKFLKDLFLSIKNIKSIKYKEKINNIDFIHNRMMREIESQFKKTGSTSNKIGRVNHFGNKNLDKGINRFKKGRFKAVKHRKDIFYPKNNFFIQKNERHSNWGMIAPKIFLPKLGYKIYKPWYYDYLYLTEFQGYTPLYLPYDVPYYIKQHIHDVDARKDNYLINLLETYRRNKVLRNKK